MCVLCVHCYWAGCTSVKRKSNVNEVVISSGAEVISSFVSFLCCVCASVCVCVCVCGCVCFPLCFCLCVCTHALMCMYECVHLVCVCGCECGCVCVFICVCVCVCVYLVYVF